MLMPVTPLEEKGGILARIFQNGSSAKVLDFFIDHRELDYSLGEVAEKAKISIQTASREIGNFEKMGILKNQRTIGKTTMYRLNQDVQEISLLREFALQIAQVPIFQKYPENNKRQGILETTINP